MTEKRAVVLLSGGLDSATVLAMAKAEGYTCYALGFDYGQRSSAELMAAQRVAADLDAREHKVVKLDLRAIGGSALTDDNIDVPEEETSGIPVTYVPARNTVFLSIALGGRKCSGRRTSLSVSTRWIIRAIRIAARNTSRPSSAWPTWPRGPGLRGTSSVSAHR